MKKYNVIIVFDKDDKNVLMCKREKEPYKGKFNLVGGKVEEGESDIDAAYRELNEETGIKKDEIKLTNLMNLDYKMQDMTLEVYTGRLKSNVGLVEEINKLYWIDKNEDFYDNEKYAGEGNIGHMMKHIDLFKDKLF